MAHLKSAGCHRRAVTKHMRLCRPYSATFKFWAVLSTRWRDLKAGSYTQLGQVLHLCIADKYSACQGQACCNGAVTAALTRPSLVSETFSQQCASCFS